ncbi:MAG: ABC transporter permease [Candidatus Nanoarchaeia archaeon]|nr:ABC transporter permease [Candidatus Nanoarchaeia archaeon]
MKIRKSLSLALNILFHSKLRSWLTILGIVIGVAAVVSIVSISEGAKQQLEDRLGSLGADILTVSPGASRASGRMGEFRMPEGGPGGFGSSSASSSKSKNLTKSDVLVINAIPNVKYAMGTVSGRASVTYGSKSSTLSVQGVDTAVWKEITTDKLASGRLLSKADTFSVVLGGRIVESIFEDGIPLNSKVIIEGTAFKVVGILQEGSNVYMPIDMAREVVEGIGDKKLDSITVKVNDVSLTDSTIDEINRKLMLSRGILKEKDKDFSVSSMKAMQETMQETMSAMTLFLGAIAVISLIVGAIGIANTMFTSVLEKTREIGIMKAIGSKNRDIMLIFLFNSGLIGFVGGIGGIILGWFGSGFISSMAGTGASMPGRGGAMGFLGNAAVTPELIIGALLVSVAIGMVAGAIPAFRASRLKPVDALRYE